MLHELRADEPVEEDPGGTVRKIEASDTRDPGLFTVLSLAATLDVDAEKLIRLTLRADEATSTTPRVNSAKA